MPSRDVAAAKRMVVGSVSESLFDLPPMYKEHGVRCVHTALLCLLGEPLPDALGDRRGKRVFRLLPPGQFESPKDPARWLAVTPKVVADVLRRFVPMALTLCDPRVTDFATGPGAANYIPTAWFLDNYWPSLRRTIGSVMSDYCWPSTLNAPLQLFPSRRPDSIYAAVGVDALDAIRQAIWGASPAPNLVYEPSENPGGHEHEVKLWRSQENARERAWLQSTANHLKSIAPAVFWRIRELGSVPTQTILLWDRGVLAELDEVQRRSPEMSDSSAAQGSPPNESDANVDTGTANAPLSQRQMNILQAMWELEALSSDTRVASPLIAQKAEGPSANVEGFKDPIAKLKKLGYVGTKSGPGGGCWLTAEGQDRAKPLAER